MTIHEKLSRLLVNMNRNVCRAAGIHSNAISNMLRRRSIPNASIAESSPISRRRSGLAHWTMLRAGPSDSEGNNAQEVPSRDETFVFARATRERSTSLPSKGGE